MKVYNKLVRDKIPEIIEADGKVCRTHILSNEEYIVALEAKLNEDVAEYQADNQQYTEQVPFFHLYVLLIIFVAQALSLPREKGKSARMFRKNIHAPLR